MQPPSEALVCARPEDGRARAVVTPGRTGELLEVALTHLSCLQALCSYLDESTFISC